MGRVFITTVSILGALAVSTATSVPIAAQDYYASPAAAQGERLAPQALEALLAPIALYPDQLLAPVLMAATYPYDVEQAANWTATAVNASLRGDALAFAVDGFDWDPSVKTLAQFPDVLRMLDDEYDWMVRVGNAFLLQERDVMDAVQRLRHQAYAAGHLRSTDVQRVRFEGGAIVIDMIDPATVYVPSYDPVRVYGAWSYPDYPPYYFYRPVIVSRYVVVPALWGWTSWEWNRHRIRVDLPRYRHFNRHHPWRFNDDTWRHDRSRANLRRDDRRDGWRDNDRRRFEGDRRGPDRGGNQRTNAPRVQSAPAGAYRGDPVENRQRMIEREQRGPGNSRGRPPIPNTALAQPAQTQDEGRERRRNRNEGQSVRGNAPEGAQPRNTRAPRQAYGGPQLTPPGPVAPIVNNPATPAPEPRQMRAQGAFRGDPADNRRQVQADNDRRSPRGVAAGGNSQFRGTGGGGSGEDGEPRVRGGNRGGNGDGTRGGGRGGRGAHNG